MEWGLRQYPDSANTIWDGDKNCEHEWEIEEVKTPIDHNQVQSEYFKISKGAQITAKLPSKQGFCNKCGAWFGQLGLEPTLELYIEHLLQVTAELKRVLKPTGVMFWNHGDSYHSHSAKSKNVGGFQGLQMMKNQAYRESINMQIGDFGNIPDKCMAMQNYRLALRMIDEQNWILRNIIIWSKPNHLPESVKDRFTRSYEPIFMFVKNKKYFFDLDAVREPIKTQSNKERPRMGQGNKTIYNQKRKKWTIPNSELVNFMRKKGSGGQYDYGGINSPDSTFRQKYYSGEYLGKNPGDVWTITTQPFPEAHFATFPEELVRRCIKAGCPKDGIVLDPFVGSGTTIKVAIGEKRNAIGIEIVPEYIEMTIKRCNLRNNPFINFEYIT